MQSADYIVRGPIQSDASYGIDMRTLENVANGQELSSNSSAEFTYDRSSKDSMKPFAIVLHGPTSAGKSTTAAALQNCAPVPAFHVTLDAFVTMSRRRDMRSAEEQRLAYRIHCENLRSTLRRLVETDFEIILDTVLRDEAELQACLDILSPRSLCLVGIKAPLGILEHRECLRHDRTDGMAREQFGHPVFARPYDVVVDTSACTPEDTAKVIRAYMAGSEQGCTAGRAHQRSTKFAKMRNTSKLDRK